MAKRNAILIPIPGTQHDVRVITLPTQATDAPLSPDEKLLLALHEDNVRHEKFIVENALGKTEAEIKWLKAEVKRLNELVFAYESVRAPVN